MLPIRAGLPQLQEALGLLRASKQRLHLGDEWSEEIFYGDNRTGDWVPAQLRLPWLVVVGGRKRMQRLPKALPRCS